MADNPVNGSNKPVNGRSNKIERIQQQRESDIGNWSEEQEKLEIASKQAAIDVAKAEQKYYAATDSKSKIKLQEKVFNQQDKESRAIERFNIYEENLARKVNKQAAQEISTYTKHDNVNARTTTMASSQKNFSQIMQNKRTGGTLLQAPTEAIEERIANKQQQISRLGESLSGRTMDLGYEDWDDKMKSQGTKINRLQNDIALDKRLLKVQNKLGMTTEKRQYGVSDTLNSAGNILSKKQMVEDVKGGKYGGSLENATKELADLFGKLTTASEKFEKASENATDAQGQLTKEYLDSSKDLDKLQKKTKEQTDAVAEYKRQGGGSGFTGMQKAQMGFGVLGAVARTGSAIALDMDLTQTNQKAQYANIANQQYQDTDSMLGGNMSSLLKLTKGDAFAKAYANKLKSGAKIWKGAEAVAATGDAAVQTADAIKQLFSLDIAGTAAGKLTGAAGATANATVMAAGLGRGTVQGAYELNGYSAGQNVAAAANAIPADTLQAYYNTQRSSYTSSVGLGKTRAGFMKSMTSKENREAFAAAGLSPQQAIAIASSGIGAIGGDINSKEYASLALNAGKVQQRGVMSAENYVGNVGQLSSVGGGAADLENIMSKAVTVGMENAKNINQMVSATAALSAASAGSGINSSSAVEDMLSSSVQSLRSMGVSKNLAVGAAIKSANSFNSAVGVKGSLADLQFRAEARGIYGENLSMDDSVSMAGMSIEDMTTMLSGGENAYKTAFSLGMEGTLGINKDGSFRKGMRGKFEELRRNKVKKGIFETTKERGFSDPKLVEEITSIKLGEINIKDASATARKVWSAITKTNVGANVISGSKKGSQINDAEGDELGNQNIDIINANRQNTKINSAQQSGNSISSIAETMKLAIEKASPEEMTKAVSKAASDMTTSGSIFAGASDKFDKAVDRMVEKMAKILDISVDTNIPKSKTKKSTNKISDSGFFDPY